MQGLPQPVGSGYAPEQWGSQINSDRHSSRSTHRPQAVGGLAAVAIGISDSPTAGCHTQCPRAMGAPALWALWGAFLAWFDPLNYPGGVAFDFFLPHLFFNTPFLKTKIAMRSL